MLSIEKLRKYYKSIAIHINNILGGVIMKKITMVLAVLLTIAFLVTGCVKITAPVKTTTNNDVTDDDNVQTPDPTPKKCVETVNYQVLIDALPTEVNGYVAGEAQGNMLTFNDPSSQNVMKYSTASVSLTKDDKSIRVTTTDTCYIPYLSMAWVGYYEMEGTDGFLKKATISGYPGWHQYSKSSETYTYNVFLEERIIVTVDGDSEVADRDVEAVANDIDFRAIVAAAK